MTDFLLELRCEEIPARMQLKASEDLARLFTEELAKAGLTPEAIDSFVTPRRLALIARGLPLETAAVSEEHKGPRTSAPSQALEGFLRKTGLTQDQLEDRDGIWFAVVNKPGRATPQVLAEAVPTVIRAFPWPKSMRWGTASQTTTSLRWVRPLQGIVAILGEELVDIDVEGTRSSYATLGHRFHHPGEITIGSAHDYVEKLRACHVIVSHQERQAIIAAKAAQAAAAKGYSVIEDKGLVAENAGLTEWPVPLLGDFDPAFLEVPPEVIQLTLRINQKYFVLRDGSGVGALDASQASKNLSGGQVLAPTLAPAFICTANIEAKDGGAAIIAGNRKVLAARLSDARFFWEQDRKTAMVDHAKKLERITFHEKLGTVADKVERIAKLARWLVEEGIVKGTDADQAEQAARLAKADLVTEMVGEFPELQGVMGGYYARAEGLPAAVADTIRDHYKPVGQGDDVPTAPVTVAVSLADKLDTLFSFWKIQEFPTGSKDPFALRRAALAVIRIIADNSVRLPLNRVIAQMQIGGLIGSGSGLGTTLATFAADPSEVVPECKAASLNAEYHPAVRYEAVSVLDRFNKTGLLSEYDIRVGAFIRAIGWGVPVGDFGPTDLAVSLLDFFADRLKVQQREAGVRHDLIDAVFALGGEDDLVRLLARVTALQSFVASDDGTNLLAGYKRAANILKKEAPSLTSPLPSREGPGVGTAEGGSASSAEEGSPTSNSSVEGRGVAEVEPAEAALIMALDAAEPRSAAAVAGERFEDAMAALATLRAPIDAFFESVTVNDADPAKRAARLALLARVRAAVHGVADFSKISG